MYGVSVRDNIEPRIEKRGAGGVLLYYYCTMTDFDGSTSFLGESFVCMMMKLLAYLVKNF